jgi:hypothetical protein
VHIQFARVSYAYIEDGQACTSSHGHM